MVPSVWRPFPTAQTYPYNHNHSTGSPLITSPIPDSLFDLCDQFNDFGLEDLKPKPVRSPPPEYLCHLCFKKGHYIRDCPQVRFVFKIINIK